MARKNRTRYAILGFLASEPGSGYDIRTWLGGVSSSMDVAEDDVIFRRVPGTQQLPYSSPNATVQPMNPPRLDDDNWYCGA